MRSRNLLPAALLTMAALTPARASATGVRHCELVVLDAHGDRLTPSPAGTYDVSPEAEVTVVTACVDSISAFPHVSSHDLTPPELRLERAQACRASAGVEPRGLRTALEPLTQAPDLRAVLHDPKLSAFAWRGRLPPGNHELIAGGAALARVAVAGEAPPLAACAPPPVDGARERQVFATEETVVPEPPRAEEHVPHWDDRRGRVWELGAGPFLSKSKGTDLAVGGLAVIGLHYVVRYARGYSHEKSSDPFGRGEWTRWCVSLVACGGIGLLAMPAGVWVGNELGVDLRVAATSTFARASLRPVLRYARGIFRTTSLLGLLTPEVGAQARLDRPRTDLSLRWSLFPIDVSVSRALALGFDPLAAGLLVGLSERGTGAEVGGEITLRITP